MSSRVLRRLQGKDSFIEQIDDDINDEFDNNIGTVGGGARRKTLPVNPFDVLDHSLSESDAKEEIDENEVVESVEPVDSNSKRKKKKKKKGKSAGTSHKHEENDLELDDSLFDSTMGDDRTSMPIHTSSISDKNGENRGKSYSSPVSIKLKNLNPNNELKRIFGTRIVENDNGKRRTRGGRTPLKTYSLVNPKETWPPLGKTGISMKVEKVNGRNIFSYVHSPDYQKIQRRFLYAVESLNPEHISVIINSHPYHVDALIQFSELCKLNDDLQMAAELNERALYCLEAAFHPLFNIALGNCQLDYRRQENRAFFICLFKHLNFVGQRACYQTALELCKLLLSLDFESDPMATLLCVDFYSLRSRNYTWLIDAANEWEIKKNLSQLPNFAYSTALAHFFHAESEHSEDFSTADRLLQEALILFPGVLNELLDKCSIQCDTVVSKHPFFTSDAELRQSQSLKRLILLYVNRTYHEWKNPKILPWLEKNVHAVLKRVDSRDPFVKECAEKRSKRYPSTPRNVLRHIILSDIKEVTPTIAGDITSPIFSFDPLPPLDSVDLYVRQERERHYEHSPTLSLFFRSLLPNFNVNGPPPNRLFIDEAVLEEAAGMQAAAAPGAAGQGATPAAIGDTLRYSVTVLMDAVSVVLANMRMRDEADDNDDNERHLRHDSDESENEGHNRRVVQNLLNEEDDGHSSSSEATLPRDGTNTRTNDGQ